MAKRRKAAASARPRKPASKNGKDGFESYLPTDPRQAAVVKIAAAAAGALIAAAVLGVGPAALAGAAGYLVYRETHR